MKHTTSKELLDSHHLLCKEARELMQRKNSDYKAGSGDAFANFRMSQLLHIDPAIGAMLRMQDKMARLLSFIEKGTLAVKEESWHDCCIDLINYSIILRGILAERVREDDHNKGRCPGITRDFENDHLMNWAGQTGAGLTG